MFSFQDSALHKLGWTPTFTQQWLERVPESSTCVPGRIVEDAGADYLVRTPVQAHRAVLAGRLLEPDLLLQRPTVGDWVALNPFEGLSRIEDVLGRGPSLTRRAIGRGSEGQTIAANVDIALIVVALSPPELGAHVQRRTLNAGRVERYLALADGAGLESVIVANKADLGAGEDDALDEFRGAFRGRLVLFVSAVTGVGMQQLHEVVSVGRTAVLIGSSGVGKSTLANRLLGREVQRTSELREQDGRGRHTTTSRHLFEMVGGGLLIDTPGMREVALWAEDETAQRSADPLSELSRDCRFADCKHDGEPGCAVRAAIEEGTFSTQQLERYRKMQRELEHQMGRRDAYARHLQNKKNRAFAKQVRKR